MPGSMKMRATRLSTAIAGLGLLALSGCQTAEVNPTAGGGGLAGSWLPANGGYTASFNNGVFSTVAADTGNVISQGSYIAISESEVELTWTSNITGNTNIARCQRPDADTLDCTDDGGRQFVLRRRSA